MAVQGYTAQSVEGIITAMDQVKDVEVVALKFAARVVASQPEVRRELYVKMKTAGMLRLYRGILPAMDLDLNDTFPEIDPTPTPT